jgi:hypothetical protein
MTCAAPYNQAGAEELRLLMLREDYSSRKSGNFARAPIPLSAQAYLGCESAAAVSRRQLPPRGSAHAYDATMTLGPHIRLVQSWIFDRMPCGAPHQCFCLSAIGWRGMLMAGLSALSREQAAMKPVWELNHGYQSD